LRDWLQEGRAQSASFEEVSEAERQFVPLQLEMGPEGWRVKGSETQATDEPATGEADQPKASN
jgi:hypothetical protein